MTGYHVQWSGPKTKAWTQWEVLLQILSAKFWAECFGPIKLICDDQTLEFYRQIQMLDLYDGHETFDMSLLDGIDPKIYFAAGKLLAQLQVEDEQCAFIDTDLLLSGKKGFDESVPTVFHRESLDPKIYPNLWEHWKMDLPHDDVTLPLNCALLVWPDKQMRRNYASHALKFMRNNTYYGRYNTNVLMVTAEQRLLGLYFKHLGVTPVHYIKDIYMTDPRGDRIKWSQDKLGSNLLELNHNFHHSWGGKKHLARDPMAAAEYTLGLYQLCDRYPELNIDNILQKLNQL